VVTPAPAPAEKAPAKPEAAQPRLQTPAPTVGGRLAETPTDKLRKQADVTPKEEAQRRESVVKQDAPGRAAQADAMTRDQLVARKDAPVAAPAPQPFPAAPPPPPAAAPAPATSSVAPVMTPEPPRAGATLEQKRVSPAAGAASAPAAAPAPAPPPPESRNLGAFNAQSAAPRADRDRGADVRAKVATTRSPDDYIREIHRLRAEGRDADAATALAAFRAAYTDADERLPDDLRAWARSVPRP
jgi:hypothetical protein